MLTVVIPVSEVDPVTIETTIAVCKELSLYYPLVVINKIGGEGLARFSRTYLLSKANMSEARKLGYSQVETKYILNLDAGTMLPPHYLSYALALLESDEKIGAVAIDYETLQGHLGFGTSIWRTSLLQELYDWNPKCSNCECTYMWAKLRRKGYKIATLSMRAKKVETNAKD